MIVRPRSSTLALVALVAVAALLAGLVALLGRTAEPAGRTVVTVRLWDAQVATAYRESFAAFSHEHPDIEVRTNVFSYASYSTPCAPTWPAAVPMTSSGSTIHTSPSTPTMAG